MGYLGKDAETTVFENGGAVVKFSVGATEKFTKKDGTVVENTTWFNVELFRKSGKIAEYLKKRTPVLIEGSLKNESYEKDGVTKYITKVKASNVVLLGGKDAPSQVSSEGSDEDTPF
jgi:single-strand DNA-binding protein